MVNSVQGPNQAPLSQPTPGNSNSAQGLNKSLAGASAAQSPNKPTPPATASDQGPNTQDRFLKLLVTQMKNQDPLNPMDNAQVTSQMAQLSTVSGIDKVNSTLKALSDSMSAGQALSATGMIGHGALVPGSTLELSKGKAIAGLDLSQGAESVKVLIKDGANNVVRTLQLGAQKAGVVPVAWDGLDDAGKEMPSGAYKFAAETAEGGKSTPISTLSFGMVAGVSPGSGGTKLDVGKLGMFSLSDIKQVM
jgi:flagellar basal-body rod modification protein FlgD